ncbi:MAG: AAA family ATPase [Mycobacterium sp.]
MTAVLITGMSGVGKSSALAALALRGYDTIDTDYGDWIHIVAGEPLWREDRIDALLSRPRTGPLFVQGTVANQGRFYHRFDAVVLLSAPIEVILERIRTRTTNAFGKSEVDRARIRADVTAIEPLLRVACTHELDTTLPLPDTVQALITIAGPS